MLTTVALDSVQPMCLVNGCLCTYLIAKSLTTILLSRYGGINYLFVYFGGGSGDGTQGLVHIR